MGLARLTHAHPISRATLRRQAERAVDSVALNIAEAAGLDGKRNKAQFRAYDESVPVPQIRELGRRVAAMLTRLAR